MKRAYIGIGSNLGDRRAQLNAAIEALDWGDVRVAACSSMYETDPVGGPPDQPPFLNVVVAVDTTLDARGLYQRCRGVEEALGRTRAGEVRWGPRAIDLDLLLMEDEMVTDPDLEVPHPRLLERAFVLVPLAEIAPDLVVAPDGTTAADAARATDAGGVRVST